MDHSPGAPKIVIADDNLQNVELLEAYLSGISIAEIRTAHDGEETLEVVNEFAPDVLLLDVMMPRLSGFEVCKKIPCGQPGNKRPPHLDGDGPERGR